MRPRDRNLPKRRDRENPFFGTLTITSLQLVKDEHLSADGGKDVFYYVINVQNYYGEEQQFAIHQVNLPLKAFWDLTKQGKPPKLSPSDSDYMVPEVGQKIEIIYWAPWKISRCNLKVAKEIIIKQKPRLGRSHSLIYKGRGPKL